MQKYLDIFINGYSGYATYLWNDIRDPSWQSYFYWLILVSVAFFVIQLIGPWRKDQAIFRKDFWLDFFYMFFNFFIFSLIIYNSASLLFVNLLNDGIQAISGFELQKNNPMKNLPIWAILLIGMVVRDFVQWWIHRLLHKSDKLWEFHKVHHSVEQMGFAAQLRYHWMENIIYRSIEYIPLALMGIGLHDFFVIHIFALAWGHFNHANITVNPRVSGGVVGLLIGIIVANSLLGVHLLTDPVWFVKLGVIVGSGIAFAVVFGPYMRYLFNSPEMHIWHHTEDLPHERRFGVNFGLTLGIWDYIFGTAYVPSDGRDNVLGFPDLDKFPKTFIGQSTSGFLK